MAYSNNKKNQNKLKQNKCTIVQTQAGTVTVQQFTNEKCYIHIIRESLSKLELLPLQKRV